LNILVIGNGAREHSLCWALNKSKIKKRIFCIPGNAGIQEVVDSFNIEINKKKILQFCKNKNISLVVIGPEQFLEEGFSDFLTNRGILVFGPSKKASKLEYSKSFAKNFLKKHKIPSANFREFSSYTKAEKYLRDIKFPIVIKADGLAAGKGVIICNDLSEAKKGLKEIMITKKFGKAGKKILIEEFLQGFEVSYFVLFDKNSFSVLNYALDHKRAFDFNKGPNTGGMGAFTPSKKVDKNLKKIISDRIVKKTFEGLKKDKIVYRGVLFIGLMITKDGPYVIEFNVRFGDPECQVLMRNLDTDILKIVKAVANDKLSNIKIKNKKLSTICVVIASMGYPNTYKVNKQIKNLNEAQKIKNIEIFHAGTKNVKNKVLSSGGRVLSITAQAKDLKSARKIAYSAIKKINWRYGFFRKDIGKK